MRTLNHVVHLPVALTLGGLVLWGCSESEPPTDPDPDPDTTAPVIVFDYPTSDTSELGVITSDYDETGNGLLDLRITWSDAESGVDPSTFDLRGINSGSHEREDWTEVALNAGGAIYEETIDHLTRSGLRRFVVSVADSAGNVAEDTLSVMLRYGDYHRSIALGVGGSPTIVSDLVICADDQQLYAAADNTVTVVDANTFDLVGVFPETLSEPPARLLCIPGDPNLYATVRVNRFDRDSLKWVSNIPGTFGTDGIAQSRLDPVILWAGEFGAGVPVQVDRIAEERIGGVGLPASSSSDEFVFSIAVLDQDEKIYYTRFWEGGVVVGDPQTGEQLHHIDIDPLFPSLGRTASIVLSPDDRYLYAALRGGDIGLTVVDTETDEAIRVIPAPGGDPTYVALDAAGTRVWLAVQDGSAVDPAPSLLINATDFSVLQEFPKPVPDGTIAEWVQAAVFHPNGHLLFEGRDDFVDVYLIR